MMYHHGWNSTLTPTIGQKVVLKNTNDDQISGEFPISAHRQNQDLILGSDICCNQYLSYRLGVLLLVTKLSSHIDFIVDGSCNGRLIKFDVMAV